ncbi:MAG: beta-propeller fold lactonase family protein [Deltaproteobacteria bacterium]|nr:beta-propeller fold lactonase family protein [Deltaproteobacteria bacterium]
MGGVDGLGGTSRLALSADGHHLYAAGTTENALAVFSRDSGTGVLTFVQALFDEAGGVSGLDEPWGVAVSADGKNVYVASHTSSAVTAFTRNVVSGTLAFLATYPDGGIGGPSLAGARELVVSGDGANVYVAADGDGAIAIFDRNPLTGSLTFSAAAVDGVDGVSGIVGAQAIAIGPDGQTVYAGGNGGRTAVFERTVPGGALTFVEAESPSTFPGEGAPFTRGIAVTPDGEHVYSLVELPFAVYPGSPVPAALPRSVPASAPSPRTSPR